VLLFTAGKQLGLRRALKEKSIVVVENVVCNIIIYMLASLLYLSCILVTLLSYFLC